MFLYRKTTKIMSSLKKDLLILFLCFFNPSFPGLILYTKYRDEVSVIWLSQSHLAGSQPCRLVSAIWLAPNKLLLSCFPDIWLASSLKESSWLAGRQSSQPVSVVLAGPSAQPASSGCQNFRVAGNMFPVYPRLCNPGHGCG